MLAKLRQHLSFTRQSIPADASVLIAITDESEPRILFTRRALTMNRHAGEVSFVGGKRDQTDISNIYTALREAHEEVGLNPFDVELLGELPMIHARNGMSVKAIIGIIPADTVFVPQPAEISHVFLVPIRFFLTHKPTAHRAHYLGRTFLMPSFHYEGEVIWGLTGKLLVEMLNQTFEPAIKFPMSYNYQHALRIAMLVKNVKHLHKRTRLAFKKRQSKAHRPLPQ